MGRRYAGGRGRAAERKNNVQAGTSRAVCPGADPRGLRSGLFTPTEAAVVAVAYGAIVGLFLTRELSWRDLWELFGEAAIISGVVMLIIALAGIFAWAGTMLGTFRHLAEWIIGLTDNGVLLLILVMLAVLIAGMLLDAISIYLIMMPILIPVMQHFEWNPVWFGILLAMNIAIGQFTRRWR